MANTSKTYSEKLKDPRWQKKRLEILDRDRWSCQICGDDTSPLNVHHMEYHSGINPWEYEDKELITACECDHEYISSLKIPKFLINVWLKDHNKFIEILDKGEINLNAKKLQCLFRQFMQGAYLRLREDC